MAKIRIYELAKELKMDNKELVRQLLEMGYDIRNHMSVLTQDEAKVVRDKIKAERSEVVEEKRVTGRVIRRRRKKVEPSEEEAQAATAEAEAEAEADQEPADQVPPAEEAAAEPEPEAGEAEQEPEPAPEAEAPSEDAAPAEEAAAEPEPEAGEAEQEQEPAPEAEAKKPGPKRRKVDMPARIISRPTKPVPPARPARPGGPRRPSPPPGPPALEAPPPDKVDEHGRPRRKKGKKSAQIPDDEFLMRKATSRRKEIKDKADLYDGWVPRGRRRGPGAAKRAKKTEVTTPKAIKRRLKVGEVITVGELSKRMGIKAAAVVSRLLKNGMMVTANQVLDVDDATLIAAEFGFEVDKTSFEEQMLLEQTPDRPEDLLPRPPVVTVMGHVDHGKTSLLDAIRKSDVVAGEAGGITQHIGAYDVHLAGGGHVVFVDTPGHEAFTEMRARGAQVTDVVVLVVAADDGVMAQTREAIDHCRAAGVPIVVAVNKIDKTGADPERVRRELAELELVPEAWGGETLFVDVSAKTGQGVDTLLEMLSLQSEILELQANPAKPAVGRVLEARLDKGRGAMATVLVQEGTLRVGDAFVCGTTAGKVRAMLDDRGNPVDEAGPSIPVEVQGFSGVPEAGAEFAALESDKTAKQIAEHRQAKKRDAELVAKTAVGLEGFLDQMKEGEVKEFNVVIKADVRGSVEALVGALSKLGNQEVKVNVIHGGTGAITESNVMLASASQAMILGFNVRPSAKVSEVAEAEQVDIHTYDVIYQAIDAVKASLTGLLAPVISEEVIGRAEVRDTFRVPRAGVIAGSSVQEGHVERGAMARLLRDGVVVANTKISSLRRFKDDVKEVAQGFECGIGLENYNDIKVGDEIEVYVLREQAGEL